MDDENYSAIAREQCNKLMSFGLSHHRALPSLTISHSTKALARSSRIFNPIDGLSSLFCNKVSTRRRRHML
jgi:hypothetical protein